MQKEIAIKVCNVSKIFKIHSETHHELKDTVIFAKRDKIRKHEVLKGLDFEIKKGESVAIIGGNGCGKSTTLKLLSRILRPNGGTIETNGRVACLIELGAGFHPDMSGRENIYINGSIFGFNRKEITERMDDIISFSELEEYIDQPVRTYSSGMYLRLAFSVAISVEAEILLIDEILAVGDIRFQNKCIRKIQEIKKKGTTIVLVSHSIGQVKQVCDRTIWLEDGKIREDGETNSVLHHYMEGYNYCIESEEYVPRRINVISSDLRLDLASKDSMQIEQIDVLNGDKKNVFWRNSIILRLRFTNFSDKEKLKLRVIVMSVQGVLVGTALSQELNSYKKAGEYQMEFQMDLSQLAGGRYFLNFIFYGVIDEIQTKYDSIVKAVSFEIRPQAENVNELEWLFGFTSFPDLTSITDKSLSILDDI